MHRFRLLQLEVRAQRIGKDGHATVEGRELVGDAGSWIVTGAPGAAGLTVWTDPEFRAKFEPADEAARAYLDRA